MRIAILVLLFPPKWLAGTEIATYNIASHLAAQGHDVHIITSWDKGLTRESAEEGFHIHRVKTVRRPVFQVLTYIPKSLPVIRKINPDIVHCQSIPLGLSGFLIKKLFGKPYVVYGRGSDVYNPWIFKNIVSKLVLRNADAIIALTEDMKKRIQNIHDRSVFVIPNGVDLERFGELPQEIPDKESKLTDEKVIIFIGTLRPVKGVRYLIEAMRMIAEGYKRTRLLLVGDGEERGYLEKLVNKMGLEDCVSFIGRVPHERALTYMVTSDVFVLPSLSEGFPMTILEAMACGLPIVATRIGGLPEVIEDGRSGFLVEPENPKEIAERVLLLLEDNELRKRISLNNKERVEKYSWQHIVNRLAEVYSGIFPNHR